MEQADLEKPARAVRTRCENLESTHITSDPDDRQCRSVEREPSNDRSSRRATFKRQSPEHPILIGFWLGNAAQGTS
jgi:hypothetical protein